MSGPASGEKTCCGSCCTLFLSLGFVVLIYWAIFQPHQIRATVDSAELSHFAVSNASSPVTVSYHVSVFPVSNASSPATVSYDVSMNLSLYNPSKRVNIYYDTLDAELRFHNSILNPVASAASPTVFYQHRKTKQVVSLEFKGKGVAVPREVAAQLESEVKSVAMLGLDLNVDVRMRYVFGSIKIRQKPRVGCTLSIPIPPPGGIGVLDSGGRCRVKY
ncbi:unnamed protein product [Urochloa humidicola]